MKLFQVPDFIKGLGLSLISGCPVSILLPFLEHFLPLFLKLARLSAGVRAEGDEEGGGGGAGVLLRGEGHHGQVGGGWRGEGCP